MKCRRGGFLRNLKYILLLALLLRGLYLVELLETEFPMIPLLNPETDMYASVQWATAVSEGDLLSVEFERHHPGWMALIGTKEEWNKWWGHPHTLRRTPLYEYSLATLFLVAGKNMILPLILQMLAGVGHVYIMFLLARLLFGNVTAGLVAAGLTAVYGPYIYIQGTLQRDAYVIIFNSLAVLTIAWAGQARSAKKWIAAGAAVGLATLMKDTSFLYLGVAGIIISYGVLTKKYSAMDWCKFAALTATAYLIVMSPLITRNIIVGLPPLALNNLTLEVLAYGFSADSDPLGANFPPSMVETIRMSEGKVKKLVPLLIEGYKGDVSVFARLMLQKFQSVFTTSEVPNNLNFYFMQHRSILLQILPGFAAVFPFAVLGVIFLKMKPFAALVIGLYLLVTTAPNLLVFSVDRYRLDMLSPLILLASILFSSFFMFVKEGRKLRASTIGAGALGIALMLFVVDPIERRQFEYRFSEYYLSVKSMLNRSDYDGAERLLLDYQEKLSNHHGLDQERSKAAEYLEIVRQKKKQDTM